MMEAVSMGKPVVVTEGLSFSGEAGASATLVADGNAQALADGILETVEHFSQLSLRAQEAQQHLCHRHSFDALREAVINAFVNEG
jgi:hypothetical protein